MREIFKNFFEEAFRFVFNLKEGEPIHRVQMTGLAVVLALIIAIFIVARL